MSQRALEPRVAALERQLTELQARVNRLTHTADWRRTIGMFAGDEVMKQIFEEGRKIREQDRERARRTVPRGKQRTKR
jgi:hypothetical protein